jgi:hypothetical protein
MISQRLLPRRRRMQPRVLHGVGERLCLCNFVGFRRFHPPVLGRVLLGQLPHLPLHALLVGNFGEPCVLFLLRLASVGVLELHPEQLLVVLEPAEPLCLQRFLRPRTKDERAGLRRLGDRGTLPNRRLPQCATGRAPRDVTSFAQQGAGGASSSSCFGSRTAGSRRNLSFKRPSIPLVLCSFASGWFRRCPPEALACIRTLPHLLFHLFRLCFTGFEFFPFGDLLL